MFSTQTGKLVYKLYNYAYRQAGSRRKILRLWRGKGKINKKEGIMGAINKELSAKIKSLPDNEKIELVDSILMQLDRPDPEIDRVCATNGVRHQN